LANDFGGMCINCEHLWIPAGNPPCSTCLPRHYRPIGSPWWWRMFNPYKWMRAAQMARNERMREGHVR
jgi:hypothetical protein